MLLHNPSARRSEPVRGFRVAADRPLAMLRACPLYEPTPLAALDALAAELGVGGLWAKDETRRMRLGSFKALGGAYAVAQMIADAGGGPDLLGPEARKIAAGMTFITASAGNHGLSVAAGARIFGARAVIVLPAAAPEAFALRIRAKGAEVVRIGGTYEESVAHALAEAEARGWLLLADGSWPGYVERPALVMEGYTVLAHECRAAFDASGVWPSHVLLQAGVGGLAASLAAHIRTFWPVQPIIFVVEPEAAPCLLRSVADGHLTHADGPASNMGRLDCKDASLLAFEALRSDADLFVTVSDDEAAEAAATLARHGIETTPSGAASLAAFAHLELPADSRCLTIVSEGREEEGPS
jgi:diaminopropionate ammonia-lyase